MVLSAKAARKWCALSVAVAACGPLAVAARGAWEGYAGDAQHTAISAVPTQPLGTILWQTPVDLQPQYSGTQLLIHYGSPLVTAANTVIVPVKTGAGGNFELRAFDGGTGAAVWSQASDYVLPPSGGGGNGWPGYNWTMSYGPVLSATGSVYFPGAGGTVYTRTQADSAGAPAPSQVAFYGTGNYLANKAAYDANVAITTPITTDAQGNMYFGYATSGAVVPGVTLPKNGIARVSAAGVGSFFQAADLQAGGVGAGMTQVVHNSAPALSADGSTVYVAMSAGNFQAGRLVALNSAALAPVASRALLDPQSGTNARLPNLATASPVVGPDGDVYMGVFDNNGSSRGWLEHFSGDLATAKPTGGFGWDMTPSIVPAAMVPSYTGTSAYLLMTKYNNYAQTGGDGVNMLAILDPNDTQVDTRVNSTGAVIMKEILKIAGPTPDQDFIAGHPNAVREWCINTAAVDPATNSILANNEDGKLYRWDLTTNTLSEVVTLTQGIGEAYTPTLVGSNGAVYAINNATLYSVGAIQVAAAWNGGSGNWSAGANWSGGVSPKNLTPAATWYNVTIAGGTVTLDVDGVVHALTLSGAGRLELADKSLVVQAAGAAEKAAALVSLREQIAAGGGGVVGITSATTLADPVHKLTVVVDNALLGLTVFHGEAVNLNSLLVESTWFGDSNLDRKVDVTDLGVLATYYGQETTYGILRGDFNQDGRVNVTDLGLLATNYGQGAGGAVFGIEGALAMIAAVPEPGTLMGLGVPLLICGMRGRRRVG